MDGNGSVAFADFLILSENVGKTAGAAVPSVPAPSGLTLLGLAAMIGCVIRRRRRRRRN